MVNKQPYQRKICTVVFLQRKVYIVFSNMNQSFANISITYELDKVVKSGFTLDYVLWTI